MREGERKSEDQKSPRNSLAQQDPAWIDFHSRSADYHQLARHRPAVDWEVAS